MILRHTKILLIFLLSVPALLAQSRYFLGAMGGVSTLSADGKSTITGSSYGVSLYKPENGPTLQILGGMHWNDYLSFEANYSWNRNDLTLSSFSSADYYEQARGSSQHTVSGDVLVYFRPRRSRIRPYLAIGLGVVRFASAAHSLRSTPHAPPIPPAEFTSTAAVVRFPVGIDLAIHHGWYFRYSFTESIRGNPISAQLSPAGERNLAKYENLFGFVKYF